MLLRRDLTTGVLGLCAVVLAVPIAAYAITGWFTRYASDDYCTASIVLQQGFLGAQQYWYSTWSGRFSFFALVSAIELGGRGVVQVLPALMLVAAVAVGAWAIGPIARRAHWRHPWLASLVLSELVVFGVAASTPNLGQSVFWQTGLLTYALPLMLLTVFVGWLARIVICHRRATAPILLGSALLMCVAGGLSETTLALQTVALGAALVTTVAVRRKQPGPAECMLCAALVGSLVSLAILALAPGNAERVVRTEYPGAQLGNLLLALRASWRLLGGFTRRFEAEVRPVFVACALVPLGIGVWMSQRDDKDLRELRTNLLGSVGWLTAWAGGGALLVCATFLPSYWVLGFDPPARIELVAQWIIVCAVSALGYTVGRWIGRLRLPAARAVASLAAVAVLSAPLSVAVAELRQLPDAAMYASQWDQNDRLLRAAHQTGQAEVVVPGLPQWWGWAWVGPRTDDFPNGCVARYYGVPAVRSVTAL